MSKTDDGTGIVSFNTNSNGMITFGTCLAVPTTANKFAKGCVLISSAGLIYSNGGTVAAPSFQDINSISTAEIDDAGVTPAKTNIVEAITATTDGLTTGTISDTTTHATVTSSVATKIVVLPTPTPGRIVWIDVGANGCELRSSAPATVAINGGTGSNAESAIAASSTILAICLSATAWKAVFLDADADIAKVEVAA